MKSRLDSCFRVVAAISAAAFWLRPGIAAHPDAPNPADIEQIRSAYAAFASAVVSIDWQRIRDWYGSNLASTYSATMASGRRVTRQDLIALIPEPGASTPARAPTARPYFKLILTNIVVAGKSKIDITTQQTSKTQMQDTVGKFGPKGRSHVLTTSNTDHDTWQKIGGKWLETRHVVGVSSTLLDGKPNKVTRKSAPSQR